MAVAPGLAIAEDAGPRFPRDSIFKDYRFHLAGAATRAVSLCCGASSAAERLTTNTSAHSVTFRGHTYRASRSSHLLSGMANGWYEIEFEDLGITPFLGGGGVGAARILTDIKPTNIPDDLPNFTVDDSDTVLAWKLGAGVGVAIAENTVLEVQYNFLGTGDVDFTDNKLRLHSLALGIRYSF